MSENKKKSRVGSIIFRIIIILIAGLTVGIGVFTWNATGLVGNQLPMPFGFGVSVILSPSMEPVLHTNDLVFVTKQDSYEVDDIVVYQEGKMLVIHRIISIDGDTVITKGDANNTADDPVSLDDIKAKLSFKIPFIGLIFKYIKTVPGTLLILAISVYLLYKSRRKEQEEDREELDEIVEEIKRLKESIAQNSENADTSSESDSSDELQDDIDEDKASENIDDEPADDPQQNTDESKVTDEEAGEKTDGASDDEESEEASDDEVTTIRSDDSAMDDAQETAEEPVDSPSEDADSSDD